MRKLRFMRRLPITCGRMGILALLVPVVLCACGLTSQEKQAAKSFSSSASAFGKAANTNFAAMQDGAVKLHELGYTTDPKFPWPSMAGKPTSAYETLLYGPFTPDRMQLREQAATVLSDYGTALLLLVTFDGSKDLQSAADALGTSIKGLPSGVQVISDADADVLSQLVQQLGGILIEQMKANAVRTIVPVYHPQIVALCTLMANDFNPAKGELTTAYVGLAAGIRNDQVTILDRDGAQLATRSRALPSFAAANKEYHWARETLPEIGKGGEKCVAASAALLDAVNNRQYSLADLKAFAQQVQKIVSTASKWK